MLWFYTTTDNYRYIKLIQTEVNNSEQIKKKFIIYFLYYRLGYIPLTFLLFRNHKQRNPRLYG